MNEIHILTWLNATLLPNSTNRAYFVTDRFAAAIWVINYSVKQVMSPTQNKPVSFRIIHRDGDTNPCQIVSTRQISQFRLEWYTEMETQIHVKLYLHGK